MSLSPTASSHALGDVPGQLVPEPIVVAKKNKKRHRDDAGDGQEQRPGSGDQPKKKKRRDKPNDPSIPPGTSSVPAVSAEPSVGKKKSKKTEKDKPQVAVPPETVDLPPSQVDPNLAMLSEADSSAAALLHAILAATTNLPDLSVSHHPNLPSMGHPLHPYPHVMLDPAQHFVPYPFIPVGLGDPHDLPHNLAHPAVLLSPAPAAPFPELTFASNDDVLRALQALDMSKITSVLKNLSEGSHVPEELLQLPPQSMALKQVPVGSEEIMVLPQQNQQKPKRTIDMSLPGTEHQTNPDHAHILATKWLNPTKLAELVKTEGLVYKKGKFSAIEEQQLDIAIENYRVTRGLFPEQLEQLIFPQAGKDKDNVFWSEITAAVPQRPIIAVYHHVRRTRHPMKQKGRWKEEEDALLRQAVADLGQQWEKVSKVVNRMSSDCRDRYRNHIENRELRVSGPWTKEEEEELTRIVTDMTIKQGKDIDNEVFWGRVSELMGGKRGRQQCRIKWTDALSKTVKNEGEKPRWSQQDAYILIHKIDSLNVRDDTEIDWKIISDPQWNLWSAHTLQRRWLTMKRSIKGHEDMTHHEIMDILRAKKAHLPASGLFPTTQRKRKERKVSSAAAITDELSNGIHEAED